MGWPAIGARWGGGGGGARVASDVGHARTAYRILTSDAFHPSGTSHPSAPTAKIARAGAGVSTETRNGAGAVGSAVPVGHASNAKARTSARSGDGVPISRPVEHAPDTVCRFIGKFLRSERELASLTFADRASAVGCKKPSSHAERATSRSTNNVVFHCIFHIEYSKADSVATLSSLPV